MSTAWNFDSGEEIGVDDLFIKTQTMEPDWHRVMQHMLTTKS